MNFLPISTVFLLAFAALSANTAFADVDAAHPDPSSAEDREAVADKPENERWYKNIVPIPMIITEPAIGEGLGLGIGYFHPVPGADRYTANQLESPTAVRDARVASKPPPVVTGVFGGVTNNGTWAAGIGHMNNWKDDRIRYLGVVAFANVVTNFYVLGRPYEFELEGVVLVQDVKFRLGQSNWFLGVGLSYLKADITFRVPPPDPDNIDVSGLLTGEFTDIGLTARVMRETRDDSLMPSTGSLIDMTLSSNGDYVGGNYDYTTLKLKFLSFHPLGERFVLGLRGEYALQGGSAPFFAVPWISLRGIPALRYQGDQVAVVEAELRYRVSPNWAAVAFVGKGWADSDLLGFETKEDAGAYGIGGRYRLLKDQGVWVGVDLAKGPEDTVFYVQVGHPW
ncbi:MAG: outer membrane protein assembly factor [Gammaproteobacteria bacterium]|nr:outer membrane protein assembly factor [Gammaproteobacteria bacterium]NNJ78204.1 BamA/TamA family outer membrane protein [Xanthomonadales bacterium]